MAERVEKVTEVVRAEGAPVARSEVRETSEATASGATLVSRIIWYVAGILLVLLAFRLVLAGLGANPDNGFANFIYSASHPFVSPFFSLFNYDLDNGVARFEIYTVVAMAVYTVIAYGLSKLVTLNRVRD